MTNSTNVVAASVFERARSAKAAQPKPELSADVLVIGRTYRAKRPAAAGDFTALCYNDRTVMWLGGDVVQYDGPSVAIGRRYPKVTVEAFLKWASHDVTDELPEGEYAPWPKGDKA